MPPILEQPVRLGVGTRINNPAGIRIASVRRTADRFPSRA
jgi:hypothetical protein